MITLKRILCPVDLSELSMLALRFAQAIAGRYRAFLTVVHVLENPYLDIPGGKTGAFSLVNWWISTVRSGKRRFWTLSGTRDLLRLRSILCLKKGYPTKRSQMSRGRLRLI